MIVEKIERGKIMICKRKDCPYNTGIKCGRITPINNELGICNYIYTPEGAIKPAAFKHTKEEVMYDFKRTEPTESELGSVGIHQNDEATIDTSEIESGPIQQTSGRSEDREEESPIGERTEQTTATDTIEKTDDK